MWFLRRAATECENEIADIVEHETTGENSESESESSSDSSDSSDSSEPSEGSDSGESCTSSSSSEDAENSSSSSSGTSSEDDSDTDDEKGDDCGGLCANALREDIDAANYEIGALRDHAVKRLDAIEAALTAEREAAATATAATATAHANLRLQSAMRSEISRAAWDEIDREFAVEARRLFIGWLRQSEDVFRCENAIDALVAAMALPVVTKKSS